jgi:hypothetical protein
VRLGWWLASSLVEAWPDAATFNPPSKHSFIFGASVAGVGNGRGDDIVGGADLAHRDDLAEVSGDVMKDPLPDDLPLKALRLHPGPKVNGKVLLRNALNGFPE